VLVPRRLLLTDSEQVRAWVVDAVAGRAELRAVELAPGEKDRETDTVEVIRGLNASDKLIATGHQVLTPGCRIRVVGEAR
jgi:hypothetical protein